MGNSANDAIERRRAESLALRRQLDGEPEPAAAPEPTDPAPTESPQHRPPRPRRRTGRRIALAVLLVLIVGGVGVAGRFHCVYGGPTSGGKIKYVTLVQKTEWGLYDQFVDLDKVVRWDVPRMLEHARTIRALVAAKWLGAEDLPAYQRELLDELGRQGFWCTGKTCKTTREACEAVRGQSTKATPQCRSVDAWCFTTTNGKGCYPDRAACEADRVDQLKTDDRPTSGCTTGW